MLLDNGMYLLFFHLDWNPPVGYCEETHKAGGLLVMRGLPTWLR